MLRFVKSSHRSLNQSLFLTFLSRIARQTPPIIPKLWLSNVLSLNFLSKCPTGGPPPQAAQIIWTQSWDRRSISGREIILQFSSQTILVVSFILYFSLWVVGFHSSDYQNVSRQIDKIRVRVNFWLPPR